MTRSRHRGQWMTLSVITSQKVGENTDLRSPVVQAANRAMRLRVMSDVIADVAMSPTPSAFPRARAVLETHAEAVVERLSGISDKSWAPISDEFVVALRAESGGGES